MQDETRKTKKMSWDKGYYIALILCIAAVGVSGYLFTTSVTEPTTVTDATSAGAKPFALMPTKPTESTAGKNDTLPTAAQTPPRERQTAAPTEAQPQTLATVSPVEGELLQGYSMDHLSYNSTTKDWRTHDGVDISCAVGTQVVAAADGEVESVYEDDFLGTTVTIRHANGFVTRYSNLDGQVKVSAGQQVQAGDVLGTVGKTALLEVAAKPHLHFAAYRGDASVDPAEFLDQ